MRRTFTALCLSSVLGLTALPAHAADAPVTPTAPVVVDECGLGKDRVKIPDVTGVQYLFEVEGQTIELTPGDYAGIFLLPEEAWDVEDDEQWDLPDATGTITAEATDGFTLAAGAPTSFDVTLSSTACASTTSLVTATSSECGTLTFTNPAGNPEALVLWVDTTSLDDYAEVVVPAGTSRTVTTDAKEIDWFALDDSMWGDDLWEDELEGASKLGATVPDYVATQEDRDLLAEEAEFVDDLLNEGLGWGAATVSQECAPTPVDEPGGTAAPAPTPEIPAVVQTDGVTTTQHAVAAPLFLGALMMAGALASLAGARVLRARRQD